jgi:transposase
MFLKSACRPLVFPLKREQENPMSLVLIGVDPHKSTHTASAVDPVTNRQFTSLRIHSTLREYRKALTWAKQWPERKWAIENANGLGRHFASWLMARGETVLDVSSSATARVRQLSRGGRRKNDQIDAAAAACVAALQGDAREVRADDSKDALSILDERRMNLAQSRVRAVNQLHSLLRDLLPGGAPTSLNANDASGLLRSVRPQGRAEEVRKSLAKDLVVEIRRLDNQLKENQSELSACLEDAQTSLQNVDGVGPVLAGRLIARAGRASRFPTAAAFANYAGVAPVEVASADKRRHRLSRFGDRQLNSAFHTIAMVQIRMKGSQGHTYYVRKMAEGKTSKEARRCLKRQLANHVWRTMIADEKRISRSATKVA